MTITKTYARICGVRGVRLYDMRHVDDQSRGNLTVGEFGRELPFIPRRYFITYDIPSAQTRGEHAHRRCEQFLICVSGRCNLALDDGIHRVELRLDRPSFGVYVPPMVWATEFKHTADSALLVFASRPYEPEDYIRDYSDFLQLARLGKNKESKLPVLTT